MVEKELDKAAAANRDADLLKKKYEVSLEKADEEAGRIVAQAKERAGEEYEKMQMLLKSWKMQRKCSIWKEKRH